MYLTRCGWASVQVLRALSYCLMLGRQNDNEVWMTDTVYYEIKVLSWWLSKTSLKLFRSPIDRNNINVPSLVFRSLKLSSLSLGNLCLYLPSGLSDSNALSSNCLERISPLLEVYWVGKHFLWARPTPCYAFAPVHVHVLVRSPWEHCPQNATSVCFKGLLNLCHLNVVLNCSFQRLVHNSVSIFVLRFMRNLCRVTQGLLLVRRCQWYSCIRSRFKPSKLLLTQGILASLDWH